MSRKILSGMAAAAFVAVFCGSALAADLVDNPAYTMWSKFKPGTTVKYKTTMTANNTNNTTEMSYTLKEVTAEKVVVEMTTRMNIAGMDKPMENTMKLDFPAKIAKDQIQENKPDYKELGKGEEDVKVGDKTYKCQWREYEVTVQAGDQKMVTKTKAWSCGDVPGSVVKTTSQTTGAMASQSEMVLVEFKAGQ